MSDSYCDCLGAECSNLDTIMRERDNAVRQLAALQKRYNAKYDEVTALDDDRERLITHTELEKR